LAEEGRAMGVGVDIVVVGRVSYGGGGCDMV